MATLTIVEAEVVQVLVLMFFWRQVGTSQLHRLDPLSYPGTQGMMSGGPLTPFPSPSLDLMVNPGGWSSDPIERSWQFKKPIHP